MTDITKTITNRIRAMGMSQAQFAECISATPAQVGLFLKHQGSLSTESLNKCFDLIGINLDICSKRLSLAREVAEFLKSKSIANIDSWTKDDLSNFTQRPEIRLFFDIKDQQQYIDILSSGVIDIESTFPYLKASIAYFLKVSDSNITSNKAKDALRKLMDEQKNEKTVINRSAATLAIGAIAATLFPVVGVAATVAMTTCRQVGAYTLFTNTAKDSLFAKSIDYVINKIK